MVVATQQQTCQVRHLDNNQEQDQQQQQQDHTFQTIDAVRQLLYCPTGRYLLALEGGAAPAAVRAYLNWNDPAIATGAPICPRIAGCVSPSYSVTADDQPAVLDVIEFPQRDTPIQV